MRFFFYCCSYYMKKLVKIVVVVFFLLIGLPVSGQNNTAIPHRTPEQEAIKQTEKLQLEVNLTPDQQKQIYEINLRYARERQVSNTRSEALERIKNKNAEMQRVLTENQYTQLQNKRFDRTSSESVVTNRSLQTNSSNFRSTNEFRQNSAARTSLQDGSSRSSSNNSTLRTVRSDFNSSRASQNPSSSVSRPQSVSPAPSSTRSSAPTPSRSSSSSTNSTRR